ncbi:AarF/UbiB family protein [Fulvimonas sp. R45]|uniref:ABC1 kinase family protein n=1 Tax=Fulvimonas sp. R45 TaxID=3045937 RepID=UPI00265DE9B0|nr:AarF/UbiB family protein [Fulvimonas sp. R45]MDO1527235.1 AarF/UbiB family protein [Fulvimonas sp. R45]
MIHLSRGSRIALFALRCRRAGIVREPYGRPAAAPDAALRYPPHRFVDELEALGPAFIKLGQALSSRPDLVRPPYLAALARIQDEVAPIDAQAVRETIAAELGDVPERLFRHFDPVPLAAGSLAQVHAVVLPDGGEAVVKVQRPDIEKRIHADLDTLQWMARATQRYTDVGRRYGAARWIDELRASLLKELDFLAEAMHLRVFADHLARYETLYVPVPYPEFCSTRVLTMSRVRGSKLGGGEQAPGTTLAQSRQAAQLLCAYVDQVFVHGLVHADPHPGNLVAMDDGRLALLDFGMVASLSPGRRREMLQLILAAAEGSGDGVAEICEAMCTPLPEADRSGFRRAVSEAVLEYVTASAHSAMGEGRLLLALTTISADHGMRPPSELSLLGRALLNLESALLLLSPGLPTRELLQSRLPGVLASEFSRPMSLTRGGTWLLQMQRLLVQSPGQLGKLLGTLSENRFKVRLDGLEDSHLIENLQKIANRIAAGVITAALLIAGALISRVRAGPGGYGVLSLAMFGIAGLIGAGLVFNSLRRDRAPRDKDDLS